MKSFQQLLREHTLRSQEGKTTEDKAFALNLIEAIIRGEEDIVDKVVDDRMTQYYIPKGNK